MPEVHLEQRVELLPNSTHKTMSGFISFLSVKFFEVVIPAGMTILNGLKDVALAALVTAVTAVVTSFVSKYSPISI